MPRAKYENPPAELLKLGNALKAMREQQGLKQIEAATAAGMTESQVSDIERGKNNPGWLLLIKLVESGLGLSLKDLADVHAGLS